MDWFAIVSCGTYPTPTPTAAQRAAYAVSYGLLDALPAGDITRGLVDLGTNIRID